MWLRVLDERGGQPVVVAGPGGEYDPARFDVLDGHEGQIGAKTTDARPDDNDGLPGSDDLELVRGDIDRRHRLERGASRARFGAPERVPVGREVDPEHGFARDVVEGDGFLARQPVNARYEQ